LTSVAAYVPVNPCVIEVELAEPEAASEYAHRRGVDLTDSRTIASTAEDWWTAWRQMYL
jgi:D-aminopeptidase